MNKSAPISIALLGWFLILSSAFFIGKIVLMGGAFSSPHNIFNLALKGAALVAGYGFLRLKLWAVVLYFVAMAVGFIRMFVWPPSAEIGEFFTRPTTLAYALIIPAVVGAIVAVNWQKFRDHERSDR